jgi:predicted nucleic acid-binding protein
VIVVDASVLTDSLLGRRMTMDALQEALDGREYEPLHAPELIEPETLNALRRLARSGAITDRRATEAAADLANLRLVRYPHGPLRDRVWSLRHALSAYDATYLALAEALGSSVFLTADRGLANKAIETLGKSTVRHIG